jgi:hypothetical protein
MLLPALARRVDDLLKAKNVNESYGSVFKFDLLHCLSLHT